MEEYPHLVRDQDVWKNKGGRHVHGLLVFWFVPVSLLVFLSMEKKKKKQEKQMGEAAEDMTQRENQTSYKHYFITLCILGTVGKHRMWRHTGPPQVLCERLKPKTWQKIKQTK